MRRIDVYGLGALLADARPSGVARRHDRALVDTGRTEFVVGGIGSSIIVGHDNW